MVHCAVQGCTNESYAGCLISFHMFPKAEELKHKWLTALGKRDVNKNARICHQHFREEDFEYDTALRRQLKPNVVPSIFLGKKVTTAGIHVLSEIQLVAPGPSADSKRTLEDDVHTSEQKKKCFIPTLMKDDSSTQAVNLDLPKTHKDKAMQVSPDLISTATQTYNVSKTDIKIQTSITKNEKLMRRKIQRAKNKNMKMKTMLALIKKKTNNYIEIHNILKTNYGSMENINTKGLRYSVDVKKLALTLHFYSPKAYRFLRNVMILPHPSTLRKMLRSNDCNVGFIDEVFHYLKAAAQEDRDIRNVALMFDAMSIRSQVTYDKSSDKHWGYVDYGGIAINDCETMATEALVFMIVSLKKKFKCPIGYFFIDKLSAELQANLVECAVRMLNDINITVKTVTCDGTCTNIATYEKLGCKFDQNEIITSFIINGNKIFALLDPPHMLKLARNALAETKLRSNEGDISFKYIEKLNQVQIKENMTFANKLTTTHVNFAGKK